MPNVSANAGARPRGRNMPRHRPAQVPPSAYPRFSTNTSARPKAQYATTAGSADPRQAVLGLLEKPAVVVIENQTYVKIGWEMGKNKIKGNWVFGRVERGELRQIFQSGAPVGDQDVVYLSRASRYDYGGWLLEIRAAIAQAEMDGRPTGSHQQGNLQTPTPPTGAILPDTTSPVIQEQHTRATREIPDLMTPTLGLTGTGTPASQYCQTPAGENKVGDKASLASKGLLVDISSGPGIESKDGVDCRMGLDGKDEQFDPFKWLLPAGVFRT